MARARDFLVASLVACIGAVGPGEAQASSFDLFGFSARATGMGGAHVALGFDYDAVYYNPANILSRKRTHLGFGLDLVLPALSVDVVRGDFAPITPEAALGFHLGVATPISGVFDNVIGFGVALFHPLTSGTRIASIDPATPYFYRYQNLPDKLIVAIALAAEPVAWMRLGVGAQILAEFGGSVRAELSLVEGRFTREDLDVEIAPTLSPTAGLALGPFEGVRVGLSYRHRLELAYDLPVVATIEGIGDLSVMIRGVSLFTPSQLSLGVGWESAPTDKAGWAVEAGLTWERWSEAPPPGAAFELTIDDAQLRDRAEPAVIVDVASVNTPLGAKDTLVPRAGIEWRPVAEAALRVGFAYRVTPLPKPAFRDNPLDSSAVIASLGGGITFGDPTRVATGPVTLDLSAQLTHLLDRGVSKLLEGERGDGYVFGGAVWRVSLDLRHDYF